MTKFSQLIFTNKIASSIYLSIDCRLIIAQISNQTKRIFQNGYAFQGKANSRFFAPKEPIFISSGARAK